MSQNIVQSGLNDTLNEDSLISDIGGDISILHIEDDPDFADLVQTFLKQERDDFEIITETSPKKGLQRLQEEDVDCIVSDYDMPSLTGLDVLEHVRAEYPDLPFILFALP